MNITQNPSWFIIDLIADWILLIVAVDVLALILLLYLERYDPRTFISWIILLICLPPVGFILYMYLGRSLYTRRQFMPKNITDRELMAVNDYHRDMLQEDMAAKVFDDTTMRLAKTVADAGGWSYSYGNNILPFTEGRDKMDAMYDDLRRARKTILMEYYIIRDDRRGNELMEILTQKVREGVEVRLLTDAFGIGKGPKMGIRNFVKAGGHYAMFHSGVILFLNPKKNNRNHRKIAIIDGEVGYCGGMNIGDEYQGEGPLGHWRDASVRIEGPGVLPLIVRFSADWQYACKKDPLRPVSDYLAQNMSEYDDGDRLQLVCGGPDTYPDNPVQLQYLAMITSARNRLYLTTPYLIPDDSIMTALSNSARSGVDVRILIPNKKDHIFMFWNNQTYANKLLGSGVKVYRYNNGFIHQKMVLVDDVCVSIGSANLDYRSLSLNFESNLMVYSSSVCTWYADQFLKDVDDSTPYTHEQYLSNRLVERMRLAVSRMFRFLS
ncbi:MAG: cardiolipin synthase [Candidatus Methanomethylophilaceae archaeon]|nr:cardiolipin synthase [Candidatus Methanomethylophilaceae archaeon]